MSGKTDKIKGRVKEAAGAITGNDKLRREGKICDSPGLSDSGGDRIMVPGGPQDERVRAGSVAS